MYSRELELAEILADEARELVLPYFRKPLDIMSKDDATPVTVADRKTEQALRQRIAAAYPGHGILGEEFGSSRIDAEYVWTLDPIDGTKSFVTGSPVFGTLISLLRASRPVIGIIDMPALGERWVGCEGRPTTFNGENVRVRACEDIGDAWLYATSPQMFAGEDFSAFERVRKQAHCTLYGADCYAYGLLANGACDLVIEATMGIYDFCALGPVVCGAGGEMTDWQGMPLGLESDGRVIAAGDAATAKAARKILAG